MDKDINHRIQCWIDATCNAGAGDQEFPCPPPKRRRINGISLATDNYPHTPPLTNDSMLSHRPTTPTQVTRKRPHNDTDDNPEHQHLHDDDGIHNTPKAKPQTMRPPPRKQKPATTRGGLQELEKPIYTKPIGATLANTVLPLDIRGLFFDLRKIEMKVGILPNQVRQDLEAIQETPFDHWFLGSQQLADKSSNERDAKAEFRALRSITRAAAQSMEYQRHEASWSLNVYWPLLSMAFSSDISGATDLYQEEGNGIPDISVRCEHVASATIAGQYIPRYHRTGPDPELTIELACAVSENSTENSTETGDGSSRSTHSSTTRDDISLSKVHSQSNSKKVDFVLVLDLAATNPLARAMSQFTDAEPRNPKGCHINHTIYAPISRSPIAASIELKQSFQARDPIIQLGIWVAAWHARMYALREQLIPLDDSWPSLVSVPLIQVTGYQWHVYFACDLKQSIDIYGPVNLGSTEDIISCYVLLRSLQAIRNWVSTSFYNGIKVWFQCKES